MIRARMFAIACGYEDSDDLDHLRVDFFFSSGRRHTRSTRDWSSDVCSSDLNWSRALRGIEGERPPAHLRIAFDEFEYGFAYRRILEGQSEQDELWTVGRTCLWPNCLFTGGHFEWRVPVDDTNTLSVGWFFDRVPTEMEPCTQDHIPYWYGPTKDPRTGRWITTHVMNQDFVAWTSQGAVADRTQEYLGESDRGVIMMRKRMLEEAEVVARGGEPKAVIRDPQINKRVDLPIVDRD